MLEELNTDSKVVGLKQSRRAVKEETAKKVFLARDASGQIRREIAELCRECNVPYEFVDTMKELGTACGINVGAAVATVIGDKNGSDGI